MNLLRKKFIAHLSLLGCAQTFIAFVGIGVSILIINSPAIAETLTCNSIVIDYPDDRSTFLANAQNTQCITTVTSPTQLVNYLEQDRTNKQSYNPNVNNEEKWFTCHQFSTQLMLRLGCFYVDSSYQLLEVKTKIRYTDSPIKVLPMFSVDFNGADRKGKNPVLHAINALYNPNSPAGLDDINNYTFIEPQNDEIYSSVEGVMNDWGIKTMDLTINAPDKINEMEFKQCRAQYETLRIARFSCKLE